FFWPSGCDLARINALRGLWDSYVTGRRRQLHFKTCEQRPRLKRRRDFPQRPDHVPRALFFAHELGFDPRTGQLDVFGIELDQSCERPSEAATSADVPAPPKGSSTAPPAGQP